MPLSEQPQRGLSPRSRGLGIPAEPPSGDRRPCSRAGAPRQLTYGVLAAGVLAFVLLQSLVVPLLPTIQDALETTQADVTGEEPDVPLRHPEAALVPGGTLVGDAPE
jgi:hypothetical protein